jgi:hypothetical protein
MKTTLKTINWTKVAEKEFEEMKQAYHDDDWRDLRDRTS